MGKIFNALEKYKKERTPAARSERLKQSDYELLLQYDSATGKLDLNHPLVNRDPGTVERLLTYRLIEADGALTPAGKAKYLELRGLQTKSAVNKPVTAPEKKHRISQLESITETPEIKTPAGETDSKKHLEPADRTVLKPSDLDILMQYDRATRNLDVNKQNTDVVRRLLGNDMIFDSGKLTPHALQLCRELEQEEIMVSEKLIGDTGKLAEIAEKLISMEHNHKPALAIISGEAPEAEPDTQLGEIPEPEVATEIAPESVEAKKESPVARAPSPKPSLPPSHNERMDRNLVSLFNPQSFEAEQFKILRSNLLYPVSGNPPRSLMVTSPLPGEGKSFVASNLAISAALNINRHVLLMDCDLRRPTIHTRFGFDDVPGLSDYLSHGMGLQDLLLRTTVDKLTILPGGQPPDNPSELLSSERMSELLKEATERYHDRLIILDSPPPTMTAESSVLARWVDGVIIVVKHGKTPRESVSNIIDSIGREKIIGAIMNNFEVHSSRYHGKYYGKYYGKINVNNNKKKNA